MGGPKVMLGTKWPSMTSTWTMVPPPRSARGDLVGEMGEVGGEDGECQFDHQCSALGCRMLSSVARAIRSSVRLGRGSVPAQVLGQRCRCGWLGGIRR